MQPRARRGMLTQAAPQSATALEHARATAAAPPSPSRPPARGGRPEPRRRARPRRRLAGGGRPHDDPARRVGHSPRPRPHGRRRGIRHDVRSSGGRLPAHRIQLPRRLGPPRRGRRRRRDLDRSASAPVRRSRGPARALARKPRLAARADAGVGRRAELLPPHPPRGPAPGDRQVRAVDGAELQRGQHRRRRGARLGRGAAALLRRYAPRPRRPRGAAAVRGAQGLKRDRRRPVQHPRRPRPAFDQPAHELLFPLGGAGDERRGAERLRRLHLGPVLRLPGL